MHDSRIAGFQGRGLESWRTRFPRRRRLHAPTQGPRLRADSSRGAVRVGADSGASSTTQRQGVPDPNAFDEALASARRPSGERVCRAACREGFADDLRNRGRRRIRAGQRARRGKDETPRPRFSAPALANVCGPSPLCSCCSGTGQCSTACKNRPHDTASCGSGTNCWVAGNYLCCDCCCKSSCTATTYACSSSSCGSGYYRCICQTVCCPP